MFKKILLIIGIFILVLALILFLVGPNLMFNFIFGKPSRSTKIPKYYIDTPHYIVSRSGMKLMQNLENEDHYIESFDGLKLHGYLFPKNDKKKFVIGVHGYRSYSRPECAPFIEFYQSLGYSMLMVDDRAHAPSEGEYIGFGVLDRLDVLKWSQYLVETYGEDIEILLHGVSMGAATVLAASGEEDLPSQVKGVVADCGYTSAKDILTYQLTQMKLPVNYFLPRIEKQAIKRAGFNFSDYSPISQVAKAKCPILFVQGEKDQMVPAYMVDELYKACTSPKAILKVKEAAHGESIAFAKEEYHQAIIDLFKLVEKNY